MDNTERRSKKEDWYDEECNKAFISRNIAKIGKDQKPTKEAITDYEEKRKIAKTNMQTEKERIFGKTIDTIEKHYQNKEIQNFYQEVTKRRQTTSTRTVYCRSKEGQLIGGTIEKLDRWAEYFEDLLNDKTEEEEQPKVAKTRRQENKKK
ncbi:hypothetical protein Zmor_020926 [Zophobas morio]|uniref:Uncharacterized protein n=1 Tax=Zophobas morio TaxID=2755281 RepID=A0AA38I4T7_9CUCU|nr:hypothetical protein Zmor_020926 [Zophobas morio]